MSLFPLTYRLCNPIIELPPRAPPCGGVSFPKASAKVQPTNQTAKLFHDFFQTFLYHRHTKHLHHAPHTPGKQKHKRTQKNYGKNTKKTHPGRRTTKNNTEENTKQTGTDIKRHADATRLSAFNTPPKDRSKNMSEIF